VKLDWFSPLPPAATGVAQYSAMILPELSTKAEITLWTDQEEWEPALERYAPVIPYSLNSIPWAHVNAADLSIFHIGIMLNITSTFTNCAGFMPEWLSCMTRGCRIYSGAA